MSTHNPHEADLEARRAASAHLADAHGIWLTTHEFAGATLADLAALDPCATTPSAPEPESGIDLLHRIKGTQPAALARKQPTASSAPTPAVGDHDARRAAFVRGRYQAGVADYLLAGDGFGLTAHSGRPALAASWKSIFDELTAAGWMRTSRSGRWWWTHGPAPATCDPANDHHPHPDGEPCPTAGRQREAAAFAAQLGLDPDALFRGAMAAWGQLNPQSASFDQALSMAGSVLAAAAGGAS